MTTIQLTHRFRFVMVIFITGLVLSGLTAFPLRLELNILAQWMGVGGNVDLESLSGLKYWIAYVSFGLGESYDAYPFIAYGTDWLAFAHLMIAVFFIGPLREPAQHNWILISGIIACISVIPLALICGPIRGIPVVWRLIDCSFGIFGVLPLLYCLRISRQLKILKSGKSHLE